MLFLKNTTQPDCPKHLFINLREKCDKECIYSSFKKDFTSHILTNCSKQTYVFTIYLSFIYFINILILYIYDILDRNFYKNVTSKFVFFFYNTNIL